MIEEVGRAIGESIYLFKLKLVFTSELFENPWLEEVCRGLARNRSIQWLTLTKVIAHGLYVDIFGMLAPFFEQNHNLFELEIVGMPTNSPQFRSLPAALKKCQHLECVRFDQLYGFNHETIPDVIQAIVPNRLESLYYTNSPIDIDGCKAIARLITSPHSKQIFGLTMSNNDLDEDCISVLSEAINENNLFEFTCSNNGCGTDFPWCFFLTSSAIESASTYFFAELSGTSSNIS
jgi:hypothetical protein